MGRGSSALSKGGGTPNLRYERIPLTAVMYPKSATKEELKQKRETVRAFIDNAKEGDVYASNVGFGSEGSSFQIVHYSRSSNKLGIKQGDLRPVALSTANAVRFIQNGARLIKRTKK